MSSSSFPLLRLPLKALRQIIEKIELYEQFNLSLCSKRMHSVVKNNQRKSPMFLNLRGFKNYADICLISQKGVKVTFLVQSEGDIYCWETYNNGEVQYRFKKTEPLFSYKNIVEGTKFLVEFLRNLFAAKVKEVKVSDNTIWMLNFAEGQQGAFSNDAEKSLQTPSSSFPLLRLPLLALVEIIDKIEPYEQFKLSHCSKRMYSIVKYYRRKSTMFLNLRGFENYIHICLFSQKYPGDKVTFRVRAKGNIYCWASYYNEETKSFSDEKSERLFSCENTIEGSKFLVEILCDLFAVKIKRVVIKNDKIWMLDFAEERQGAFSYDAEVWNNDEFARIDEQLRHILLDLNPRSLAFRQKTSDEFRLDNFHKKYDNLTIEKGKWLTIENLCQLDCVELKIFNRTFSSTEINRYFKHVLSGGAPRLRKLRVKVWHANEDVISDGIRELLTGMEQIEDEAGNWTLNGNVAREEGLVVVSIKHLYPCVYLEIKEI